MAKNNKKGLMFKSNSKPRAQFVRLRTRTRSAVYQGLILRVRDKVEIIQA